MTMGPGSFVVSLRSFGPVLLQRNANDRKIKRNRKESAMEISCLS